MAIVVLSPEQQAFLRALCDHEVRFIVVGLSSAVLQGAPVSTQDIDVWIEKLGSAEFKKAVAKADGFYIPPGVAGGNPPMLGPDSLRLFDLVTHMHGLGTFEEEYKNCKQVEIDGIPVTILPLERIIVSKEAAGRDKDKAVLPVLSNVLEVKKKLEGCG